MKVVKIQAYKAGHVRLEDAVLPSPGKNEVLIETHYSAISPGTELAWLHHMENTPGEFPYYPGYSGCGRVVAKGENVKEPEVGDMVVANLRHWSYDIVEAGSCVLLPESVSPIEASPFFLASISLQGIRKADVQIGDRVAVLGLGAIGNLAAQLAFVAGAGSVTGIDTVSWRRTLAEKCGVKITGADGCREEHNSMYDVVIEATGVPAAINTALQMARPLGTVVLLGSTRGLTDGVNFYQNVHRKGVTVVGAHTIHRAKSADDRFGHFRSAEQDAETIIKLLQAGRIVLKPLVSESADPGDAQSVYNRLLAKEDNLMLVVFNWGNASGQHTFSGCRRM